MTRPIITDKIKLIKPCEDVINQEDIQQLLTDLRDTCIAQKGLGIAAPQIGIYKKVAVYRKEKGFGILINPETIKQRGKIIFKGEGCLSFPGVFIDTDRYEKIIFKNNGNICKRQGHIAVIIQHEIDHLYGKTMFDRKHRITNDDSDPTCIQTFIMQQAA